MTIQTPDWVKNAVFYQIFPDRFARTQQDHLGLWKSTNLEPWDSPPTLQGYKGGDLWGIIEKLDYLQDLGINAIYFTPIFQSASNHRYHTHDYYQVDPMLGGNRAFLALLDAAHQREIKIVLDGVFNHASRGFSFFNDILEHGPHSAWLDWFKVEDWPLSAYDGSKPANYVGWIGNRSLPEFNHENPQVREYLMQVGEYWLKQGIDGWRLDVPNEIEVEGFWQEFRERVKAINPEAYIVGEIWEDASQWLDGTQFDGVMNYPWAEATVAYVGGDRVNRDHLNNIHFAPYPALTATEYKERINELLTRHSWEIQLTQLNLLDSHDTPRLLSIVEEEESTVELATLLLFTFPGAPSVYYGDEVGLAGLYDPDCRRTFPQQKDWNLRTLDYYKKLINIRHQYEALRIGDYQVVDTQGLVYLFTRTWEEEILLVGVNADTQPQEISVNIGFNPEKVLYETNSLAWNFDADQSLLNLSILPRSGFILR
jgi:cyclomaltodextrinase